MRCTHSCSISSQYHSGYGIGQVYYSVGTDLLIDASDPKNVTGAVPDFFAVLVEKLGSLYGTKLEIEWILTDSSQDTFTALYGGEIDSACGYWVPDGNWKQPLNLNVYARPLVFSMMQCPTMYETLFVFTPLGSDIDSYPSLVSAISSSSNEFVICVAGNR